MNTPNHHPRLQSWIPPSFVWTTVTDVFCIEVPINDPDVVEFISSGEREVAVHGTKKSAQLLREILGKDTLRGQIEEAVWVSAKLKPEGQRVNAGSKVVAHCHGVFLLPDEKNLCVLAGRAKRSGFSAWVPTNLKAEADALLLDHKSKVAEFEENISRRRQENGEFYGRNSDMKKFEVFTDVQLATEDINQRPMLTAETLLHLLPHAVAFPLASSGDPDKIVRSAITSIAESSLSPPRDGTYIGILLSTAGRKAEAIVSWAPTRACRHIRRFDGLFNVGYLPHYASRESRNLGGPSSTLVPSRLRI